MVHRQCRSHNIASPCTQDDRNRSGVEVYGKTYPQPWRSAGVAKSQTGRAEYRRLDTGEKFPYTFIKNERFLPSRCILVSTYGRKTKAPHAFFATIAPGHCVALLSLGPSQYVAHHPKTLPRGYKAKGISQQGKTCRKKNKIK